MVVLQALTMVLGGWMVALEPPAADFEALLLAVVLFVPSQLAD